jgi:uncharacterized protein
VNGRIVLDSFALIGLFNKEKGWSTVQKIFYELRTKGELALLCWINWGEVYYIIARRAGQAKAEETMHLLEQLPIELEIADPHLVRSAAEIKCRYAISYADAFCVATAIRHQGIILTSDPEFAAVSQLAQIHWLR